MPPTITIIQRAVYEHPMPTTSELLQRLDNCTTELEAHRGYLKAMEYCIRALIISHPDPASLTRVWEGMIPGIFDNHLEDSALSATAMRQGLALLTEQIEATANPGR